LIFNAFFSFPDVVVVVVVVVVDVVVDDDDDDGEDYDSSMVESSPT
jgi:hypothetical protein